MSKSEGYLKWTWVSVRWVLTFLTQWDHTRSSWDRLICKMTHNIIEIRSGVASSNTNGIFKSLFRRVQCCIWGVAMCFVSALLELFQSHWDFKWRSVTCFLLEWPLFRRIWLLKLNQGRSKMFIKSLGFGWTLMNCAPVISYWIYKQSQMFQNSKTVLEMTHPTH